VGDSGSSTASAPSSASADSIAHGQTAQGEAKKFHSSNPACPNPSSCTPANSKAGTFWPTSRHPEPHRDGSGTYANSPFVPPLAAEMAIASPAFAVNELVPKAYSCEGAGISPPLHWRNVPPNAGALILYVIDTSQEYGRRGGIRWVVANIDPHSKGVAAGKVPKGGVVGANAEGKATYAPICSPKGGWIEFQLYALSKRIPLSPGFQPSEAQGKYGQILGSATTYNVYIPG
jgi:phosphatidylethanolamine-binding protein (PEBP) family uncharacterized protein